MKIKHKRGLKNRCPKIKNIKEKIYIYKLPQCSFTVFKTLIIHFDLNMGNEKSYSVQQFQPWKPVYAGQGKLVRLGEFCPTLSTTPNNVKQILGIEVMLLIREPSRVLP